MTAILAPLPVMPLARSRSTCVMTCGEKLSPVWLVSARRSAATRAGARGVVPIHSTFGLGMLYRRTGHMFLTAARFAISATFLSAVLTSLICTDRPLKSSKSSLSRVSAPFSTAL